MEKIVTTPVAWDNTRQLHYKLVKLDDNKEDHKKTLLLTVWGKTEKECTDLTTGVMEKMSK